MRAQVAPWSVGAEAYGDFLCDVFDLWAATDVGKFFVTNFEETAANICGVMPCSCTSARACGGNAVCEHNGDVYCCDHYVFPEYKLGNIFTSGLRELMLSDKQVAFGNAKTSGLAPECLRCRWLHLCNGGCPRQRLSAAPSGAMINSFCPARRRYIAHAEEPLRRICRELGLIA